MTEFRKNPVLSLAPSDEPQPDYGSPAYISKAAKDLGLSIRIVEGITGFIYEMRGPNQNAHEDRDYTGLP